MMGEFAKYGYQFWWIFKGDQPDFEFVFPTKDKSPSAILFYAPEKRLIIYTSLDGLFKNEPIHTFLLTGMNKKSNEDYFFPGLIPIALDTKPWQPKYTMTVPEPQLETDL